MSKLDQDLGSLRVTLEAWELELKRSPALVSTQDCEGYINYYRTMIAYLEELKALRAAAELAAEQIRKCDYTPARSTLLVALEKQT